MFCLMKKKLNGNQFMYVCFLKMKNLNRISPLPSSYVTCSKSGKQRERSKSPRTPNAGSAVEMFPGSLQGPARTFSEYFLPAFRGKYHVICVISVYCVSEIMILRGLAGERGS